MTRKNPSWIALSKQSDRFGKNTTDPKRTDRFLDKMEYSSLEWTPPPEWDIIVKRAPTWTYTINRDGEFKSTHGKIMRPFFHPNKRWPRIRIVSYWMDGELRRKRYKEIWILEIMKRHFWRYFEGYSYARHNLPEYILIPKDGNYENMHYSNLKFVHKKAYQEVGSKKNAIKNILLVKPESTNKEISEAYNISVPHISRVRKEVASEDKKNSYANLQHLRKEIGIEVQQESLPIYQVLLQTKGALSNLDIAQLLYPQEFLQAKTNLEKKMLTAPIVRIRKKLINKGLIPASVLTVKKKELECLLTKKKEQKKTHQEIADLLGLTKDQVDNYARQLKKACIKEVVQKKEG